jgi:hypothetical protein
VTAVRSALVGLAACAAALVLGAAPAQAGRECDGLMVCVPVQGPWVAIPSPSAAVRAPSSEYLMRCPEGHVVGGTDAEVGHPAVDVIFLGTLGSPVNPGITTSRELVFVGTYVGAARRAAVFRPLIGCIPASGGGGVPTSVSYDPGGAVLAAVRAAAPAPTLARRVRSARVRQGRGTVAVACARGERLVGSSHAVAFDTPRPPAPAVIASVDTSRAERGNRVVVTFTAGRALQGVRATVQVHALCAREP